MSNIIIFLSATSLYLKYYYVNGYLSQENLINQVGAKLKLIKTNNIPNYAINANQEILASVVHDQRPRIIFLGTSQTWGAGASKNDETFVKVAETMANRVSPSKYQFINAGICGLDSTSILSYYLNDWLKLKPKMVIVNLSNNDTNPETLSQNIQSIIDINKSKNIDTVLLLEANSSESYSQQLVANHSVLKQIAKKENIKVIDIYQHLLSQKKLGNLWWDEVHLTSFGHQLIAKFLVDQLIKIE